MIINSTPQNEAISSNLEDGKEFSLKATAKSFGILSSGLYSNKIRAIIRELSCNAVDGHTVVNKQSVPFSVHLPSRMEPHFSVRDYGVGLSHDSVMAIYTTYFESTKTGSNDLIGGLGLGSKSPFSYTDNFTITSIFDGIRNVYTAYINDNGVPAISRMLSIESDEENGVEVSFSVQDDDFYKFREEAQYVYSTFAVHPDIVGTYYKKDINYITENIIDGAHQYDSRTFGNGGVYALMGNVVYPINVPNADKNLGELNQLMDNSLLIRFDIGSLDIQASREHLSYIPSTVKAIKAKLQDISDALKPRVVEKIQAEPNAWKRVNVIRELLTSSLLANTTAEYIKTANIPFTNSNGKTHSSLSLFEKDVADDYNIELLVYYRGYRGKVSIQPVILDRISTKYLVEVPIADNTRFFVNNGIKGLRNRTKKYVAGMESRNTLVILSQKDKTKPALFKEFLESIHSPHEITENDLPTYVATVREKIAYDAFFESSRSKGYYDDYFTFSSFQFDEEDTDIHYYMPLNNKNIVSEKFGTISVNSYMQYFSHTGIESIDNSNIIGVRKSAIDIVKKLPNWINFETYVENLLKFETKAHGGIFVKFAKLNDNFFRKIDKDLVDKLFVNSPLKLAHGEFMNNNQRFNNIGKNVPQVSYLIQLVNRFNIGVDVSKSIDKHTKVVHNIINRYPLLENVLNMDSVAVAEYINLIDTHKGV